MIRIIVFIGLVLAAALGVAWVADRPGVVTIVWQGTSYTMSLLTAIGLVAAVVVVAMLAFSLISTLLRLPSLIGAVNRIRRRSKGLTAVSRGIIAVGAGDLKRAERQARDAERILGSEPLALLLKAQTAQLGGDRSGAEGAFRKMLEDPETKVLGLRGLFVEARRRSDAAAARHYAEEAHRAAPNVPWAAEALLEYRCRDGDWRGAMAIVDEEANRRLITREQARRQRAVLFAAEAEHLAERSPDEAMRSAAEAVRLDPSLTPSAVLYGRRLSAKGDYAKATKVLEAAYKALPHPDVADAYLDVRPGDSAQDRLKRARALQKIAPRSRESRFAVARTAMEARALPLAREELEALILEEPTVRACRMMAELEMLDGERAGLSREWLARAARAPRDPAWVAEAYVSERWLPLSPVTGRLDAFVWTSPPQALEASLRAELDAERIVADHDERPLIVAAARPADGAADDPDAPAQAAERAPPATEPPTVPPAPDAAPRQVTASPA
jgi:HemY protein